MAIQGLGSILTPFQTFIWFFFGPPLVTMLFFLITNVFYVFRWKLWWDLALGLSFDARFILVNRYLCDNSATNVWYLFCIFRILEGLWFTWITSLSHFPMTIKLDGEENWVVGQIQATQNFCEKMPFIPESFVTWFSGHLNYQIEHHLFPIMPRHNYPVIAEEVKKFLGKHGISYVNRNIFNACWDVVKALNFASTAYCELEKAKLIKSL